MAFIKINKENFFHNLNQIALKTGSKEKISIVLKDNAYGHGLELMAGLASKYGIKHAVVRKRTEAKKIDTLFESILVLSDDIIKDHTISYTINTLADIEKAQKGAKVELKIDTGMHRNGIVMDELKVALENIAKYELKLVGVMTHFRSADVLSSELFWQQKNFDIIKAKVVNAGFCNVRFHSYNSAALLRTKSFPEDIVRVGIAAYGYSELENIFDDIVLKPVLSLHANKVSTRTLNIGERVGYGGDFVANKKMLISTYDLGYGDGWFRASSLSSFVTSENLPILGRVSMDFITLATRADEVCIMSDAQNAAKQLETISYEVLTSLPVDMKRQVI